MQRLGDRSSRRAVSGGCVGFDESGASTSGAGTSGAGGGARDRLVPSPPPLELACSEVEDEASRAKRHSAMTVRSSQRLTTSQQRVWGMWQWTELRASRASAAAHVLPTLISRPSSLLPLVERRVRRRGGWARARTRSVDQGGPQARVTALPADAHAVRHRSRDLALCLSRCASLAEDP